MPDTFTPGPRQTVDRCRHPNLGEGCAVYEHGPAFFLPDGGEPVPMRSIGGGGSRSGPPPYSYIVAVTEAGQRIELETTGRQHGERHSRRWSPIWGPGWLVDLPAVPLPIQPTKADEARHRASMGRMRFDPDNGDPVAFTWNEARLGRLDQKREPRGKKAAEEWRMWTCWGSFEFRDEPPPEQSTEAPAQATLLAT